MENGDELSIRDVSIRLDRGRGLKFVWVKNFGAGIKQYLSFFRERPFAHCDTINRNGSIVHSSSNIVESN